MEKQSAGILTRSKAKHRTSSRVGGEVASSEVVVEEDRPQTSKIIPSHPVSQAASKGKSHFTKQSKNTTKLVAK